MLSRLLPVLFLWLLTTAGFAQTPRLYLKFDNNLSDSSGAGIITSVSPNAGFTPTYAADRFGVANKAIVFPTISSNSLQLTASSLVGNSNQALGLRNAGGTNTSFTLSAWVKLSSLISWYNTIFGNIGSGTGTLFAGFDINNGKSSLSFDMAGSPMTSSIDSGAADLWFHFVLVNDAAAGTERIYLNGVPDLTKTSSADRKSTRLNSSHG